MNPNFETLECEMLIGVAPPPIEEDAVYGVLQHAGLHSRIVLCSCLTFGCTSLCCMYTSAALHPLGTVTQFCVPAAAGCCRPLTAAAGCCGAFVTGAHEHPPLTHFACPYAGQPCYSVCKIAQEGRAKACHRLDTERSRKGIVETAAPATAIAPAAKLRDGRA